MLGRRRKTTEKLCQDTRVGAAQEALAVHSQGEFGEILVTSIEGWSRATEVPAVVVTLSADEGEVSRRDDPP